MEPMCLMRRLLITVVLALTLVVTAPVSSQLVNQSSIRVSSPSVGSTKPSKDLALEFDRSLTPVVHDKTTLGTNNNLGFISPHLNSAACSRIIFSPVRDGNLEIYAMNPDGSDQTNLSNNSAHDFQPSVSGDGNKIAFAAGRDGNFEIYSMNADGSHQTRLTNSFGSDQEPDISADSSRIVFASNRTGKFEIFVMNADGTNQVDVWNRSGNARTPAFSPDGSKITFSSDQTGNNEIYVMNADGSNLINLTNNSASDTQPRFSHDGNMIAFISNRDGNNEVYIMNADGTNASNLTNSSSAEFSPAFSPDDSQLVFQTDRDGNYEIYRMNIDGTSQTNLSNNSFNDTQPVWSSCPTLTPIASFTIDPNPAACTQTVTLNASASSDGDPLRPLTSYEWEFGDGSSGSGMSVTHSYSLFGTYSPTLTVTDPLGQTDSVHLTVNINQGNHAPQSVSGGPYFATIGSSLTLDASASSDGDTNCGDSIVSYVWTIDGTYSISGPSVITFTPPQNSSFAVGSHSLVLRVRDTFGAVGTNTTTLTMNEPAPTPTPTPSPSPTPTPVTAGSIQRWSVTNGFYGLNIFGDGTLLAAGNTFASGAGSGVKMNPYTGETIAAFPVPDVRTSIRLSTGDQDYVVGGYGDRIEVRQDGSLVSTLFGLGCCNIPRYPLALDNTTNQAYVLANWNVGVANMSTGFVRYLPGAGDFVGTVSVADATTLYTAGQAGNVTRIHQVNGFQWTANIDSMQLQPGAVAADGSFVVTSGPAHLENSPQPGRLARVRPDGTVTWNKAINAVTPPVIGSNNLIFVGTQAPPITDTGVGAIEAYDLETGNLAWRTNVQGLPNDLLVGDDGAVYAGTGSSTLSQIYVLGQADGSVRQTITNLQGAWELLLRGGLLYSAGNAITALPVTAVNYDPNSPWPVRFHDNQRTSNRQTPILNPTRVNNGVLQFSSASYTVSENAGVATITVNRSGGGDGAVSVSYATSDGSATAGSDYTSTSGTISWANGEQGPKSFDVPIIDDGTYEGNETINLSLTNVTGGATLGTQTSAVLNILENDPTAAGKVLISEFRFRGPLGSNDEFVELYNNSDNPITVETTDGSNGWTLVTADGYQFWTINNGTVIPARGHLLGTEYYNQGSSIHNYAQENTTWGYFDGFGIPDNTGIALFQTSNSNNFNINYRIDAVGFSSVSNSVYREGAGLPPIGSIDGDFSFVRKQLGFSTQDTGDNGSDFAFVSTTGAQFNGIQSILGAPGFEGSSSPIRGNSAGASAINIDLLDTAVGATASPNQIQTFQPIVNGDKGTLELRRKITNNSASTLSKLRLRVVDITSFPSQPGTADLRVLGSADTQVNTSNGLVTAKGTSLEQPPNQFEKGGGLNSSLNVPLSGGGLAPGASVNIRILLGVCQEGNYRFQLDIPISGAQGTIATQTPAASIYGRVAYISNGPATGFSGVTISLSGTQSASTTTDVNGNYSFDGLPAGGNYTVRASKNGYIFQPSDISIPSLTNNQQANFTGELPSPNPGEMVISEFRFRGMDSGDEFVELYNNTDQAFTVSTTDGSTGWTVIVDGGYQIIQIPNGTVIPARSHFVGTEYYNQSSAIYQYAQFDTTWGYFDGYQIPDDTGIALFKTANPLNYTTAKRLDSVGFSTVSNSLYREGAGLQPLGTSAGEYSFVRRMNGFVAQDTDNNSADFVFVSTTAGAFNGVQSILGSPGPEGLSSPARGNRPGVAGLVASLLDPSAPDGGAPNQVRSFTPVTNGNNGTLEIRRKITNTSSTTMTRVRLRVNDISTLGAGGGADLRVLSSPDLNVTLTNGSAVLVKGTTLDQPPGQTSGGALNSSLSVTLPGGSLAPGASLNVRILLGVQQPGSFHFQLDIPVSVVADTTPPSISNLPGPGVTFNWIQINPIGTSPSARRGHRLVYDSDRHKVILFGGIDAQGYLNDIWEFDTASNIWSNISPLSGNMPIPRADFGMAYDQTRHRVVVYGGSCSEQFSNVGIVGDTWEFDPAARVWSQGANTIPFFVGLTGSALAYDPNRHQVIAFGGRPYWDWGTDQTWAWNGTSWTDISPATSPGKRHYHSMATDPVRNRIVMFGGRDPNALSDTWEWDGTTWTQVALSGPQPSYRWYPGLAFNESTNTTIMFGSGTSGQNLNDTWEWNGSQWHQLSPATSPSPRGTSAVYDSAQAKLILFSGAGQADTWVSQIQSEIVLEATSPSGAVATYSPTATDAVDGAVPVNCTPLSGTTFSLGTTTVQCSASDSNGNTAQVKFHVTVQDTTAPILTLPSNITTTAEGSTVTFSATAVDAVSGAVAVSCSPASGTSFGLGTTVVQCFATDALNNTAQGSFNVTVQGNTSTGSNVSIQPVDLTTGAPAPVTLTFSQVNGGGTTTVTSSGGNPSGQPLPNRFKLGNPPTYYEISTTAQFTPPVTVCFQYPEGAYHNENNLKLMHFNGSVWQDITTSLNTQTNTICGITNSFSPFVTAETDQAPQLASPQPIAAIATTNAGTSVTYNKPIATDDFDATVPVNCTPQSGGNFALGKTTVVCTATDSAGNSTSKTLDVTVTFAWSGVLDPINADGTSIFKLKSAVPVKFRLTGASAGVMNAVARLYVAKISNGVMGTELEADSNVSATSGNLFVYDGGGQYHFNWDTKGQSVGTYQLRIDLGDGVSRTAVISLR